MRLWSDLGHEFRDYTGEVFQVAWTVGIGRYSLCLRKIVRYNPSVGGSMHSHGDLDIHSLILRGGYFERRSDNRRTLHCPGQVNHIYATTFHCIEKLLRQPTWTVAFQKRHSSGPPSVMVGDRILSVEEFWAQAKETL